MHSYFILEAASAPDYCTISQSPDPFDSESWRIAEGVPMAEKYSSPVQLNMDKQHKGLAIPDLIHNTLHLPLVSERLKTLLEKESGAEIEFLPFSLHDHKGRLAPKGHFIANIIGSFNCVDKAKTEADESFVTPGEYSGIFRLFLDPTQVPPQSKLFRISSKPSVLIVRNDLRAVLEQNSITGIRFIAMGEECIIY